MVLSEKGISFDRVEIDLRARQQKAPEYLAINPAGQVPVYVDDQGVHADSLTIMQYLDERYPEPPMFPIDPKQLQTVLEWIELSSGRVRDVSHELYWQLIEPPEDGTDWAVVDALKAEARALLARMDDALARDQYTQSAYVCGGLTAADFSLLPWIHGYGRFGLPEEGAVPHVVAWLERMRGRPSFGANFQKEGRRVDFG